MADKQTNAVTATNASTKKVQKRILVENSSGSEVEHKKQGLEDVESNSGNGQMAEQSACQLCSTLLPRLEAMEKNHTNLMNKLTQEIISLRKELRDGHKNEISPYSYKVIPQRPFSELVDFIQFEKKLAGNNLMQEELLKDCYKFPRASAAKYIRFAWKKIMNDELSTLFLWRGTKTTRSLLGLTTTATFRAAFMQQFTGMEEDFFERTTTMWFNSATDRLNKQLHNQSESTKIN